MKMDQELLEAPEWMVGIAAELGTARDHAAAARELERLGEAAIRHTVGSDGRRSVGAG
jgi:hypothetical protein